MGNAQQITLDMKGKKENQPTRAQELKIKTISRLCSPHFCWVLPLCNRWLGSKASSVVCVCVLGGGWRAGCVFSVWLILLLAILWYAALLCVWEKKDYIEIRKGNVTGSRWFTTELPPVPVHTATHAWWRWIAGSCVALVCAWVRTWRSFFTGAGGGAWPCCIDACAGGWWHDVPGINLADEAEVGRAWLDREGASGVNWAGPYQLSALMCHPSPTLLWFFFWLFW